MQRLKLAQERYFQVIFPLPQTCTPRPHVNSGGRCIRTSSRCLRRRKLKIAFLGKPVSPNLRMRQQKKISF